MGTMIWPDMADLVSVRRPLAVRLRAVDYHRDLPG